jgi:hypothetical protein
LGSTLSADRSQPCRFDAHTVSVIISLVEMLDLFSLEALAVSCTLAAPIAIKPSSRQTIDSSQHDIIDNEY